MSRYSESKYPFKLAKLTCPTRENVINEQKTKCRICGTAMPAKRKFGNFVADDILDGELGLLECAVRYVIFCNVKCKKKTFDMCDGYTHSCTDFGLDK